MKKDFKVDFKADNLNYTTTIRASTEGNARDKFARWFYEKFKPEREIEGGAELTKVVVLERKRSLNEILVKFSQLFK
jgi:hypothetical protein